MIEMMECIRRLRYVLLYPALLQNRNFLVRVALIPQHLDWLQSLIQVFINVSYILVASLTLMALF